MGISEICHSGIVSSIFSNVAVDLNVWHYLELCDLLQLLRYRVKINRGSEIK
jgi:hypothetical protein